MKKIISSLFIVLPLLLIAQRKATVLVFAGQSNMLGSGMKKGLPENYGTNIKNVFYMDDKSTTFKPYVIPNKFGPEMGFIVKYRQLTDAPIYVMKYAKNGQALYHGINTPDYVDEGFGEDRHNYYPGQSNQDKNQGTQYAKVYSVILRGQKELQSKGIDATIDALFWMQGECDSRFEQSTLAYQEGLEFFHKRIQEDTNTKSFPLIFGQVLPNNQYRDRYPFRNQMHEQMNALDKAKNNIYQVLAPADKMKGDFTHYLTSGYVEIGEKYAYKLAELKEVDFGEVTYTKFPEKSKGKKKVGAKSKGKKKKKKNK